MKRAVFPGSFDPITVGHESVIQRGLELFDEIIVAMGTNTTKKYLYDKATRLEGIEAAFKDESRIVVMEFEGLTVDFCKRHDARFILRGLRNAVDFEFERSIALMNQSLNPDIETCFLSCDPAHTGVSSTIVREIKLNDGDYKQFIPEHARNVL